MPISHDVLILILQIVIMVLQAILTYINGHQNAKLKDITKDVRQIKDERM